MYASEVVEAARGHGVRVTHDYRAHKGAIPLPATLSMLLAGKLGQGDSGSQAALYSPYPFPWRQDRGGLRDRFARDAWRSLSQRPDEPFYRMENKDGRYVLRYATADRMREACVGCHNAHPDTPKRDWQEGDLRGVLEIRYPVGYARTLAQGSTRSTLWILGTVSGLALLVFGLILSRSRRWTRELEGTVEARTLDFKRSQQLSQAVIHNMGDAVVTIDGRRRIVGFNKSASSMWGYTREEVVGLEACALFACQDGSSPALPRLDREAGATNEVAARAEAVAVRKCGTSFPVEVAVSSASELQDVSVLLVRDLTQSRRAEQKLRALNDEYVRASRQAGMADIATGVLHNVGNVLNGINVSAGILMDRLRASRIKQVRKTVELLESRTDDLSKPLHHDEHGRKVLSYLLKLGHKLEEEQQQLVAESRHLQQRVKHVGAIIAKQQEHATGGVLLEDCTIGRLVDEATILLGSTYDHHRIQFLRTGNGDTEVTVDRHRVLQILVNLLSNAKDALEPVKSGRQVRIDTGLHGKDRFLIRVIDNGAGISTGDKQQVFSQGFTTKENGHGFGLHNASNAAKAMGGALSCQSMGVGRGASFTLELPIRPAHRKQPRTNGNAQADL